ncbi:MAG: hypothetical protein R2788_13975 [Saprospiraceae bacterium]
MKNFIFPIAIAVLFAGTITAQDELFYAKLKKEEVPEEVVTAVTEDFEDGIIVTEYRAIPIEVVEEGWYIREDKLDQNKKYDSYEVMLSGKNIEGRAVYDANGKLVSAVEKIKDAPLPRPVQKSLGKDYPGWAPSKDHEMITMNKEGQKKVYYKMKVTKGNEQEWITYNADGNLVKVGREHKSLFHRGMMKKESSKESRPKS